MIRNKEWTAAEVAEYDWPPEGCSLDSPPQTYMIQEQVIYLLNVTHMENILYRFVSYNL